ncbi:MAG: HEAT repeat domain-containing protein [Gammaproteobacteria bacterium]|nr:HEAT repeat domain-containing protein [Gammaproteobacteria bacterium]
MSIARILLITLLISSGIVALTLFNLESDSGDNEVEEDATKTLNKPKIETPQAAKPTAPNDMGMPGDESFDEAQIEREQIAEALSHLSSQKEEERIEAVEQLGAYPSPDTEATLSQLLTTDSNPEVRNAAALSLGSLDVPSDATLASLLTALDDQSEDVRFSALSTLEDFMLGQDEDSQTYKRIRSGLSAKVDAQSLSEDLKDSIKEVLKDPATANLPEAEPDN